jgi:hypothetical protein
MRRTHLRGAAMPPQSRYWPPQFQPPEAVMDCQTSPRPELAGFVDDSLQRADRQRLIRLVFQELYLPPLL